MNDLLYLGVFAACCAATWSLTVLCERLMPHPPSGRTP